MLALVDVGPREPATSKVRALRRLRPPGPALGDRRAPGPLALTALAVAIASGCSAASSRAPAPVATPAPAPEPATPSPVPAVTAAPAPARPPARFVDRRTIGQPWGTVPGILQFRGNPSRSWYGAGPVPKAPRVLWRFPDRPMCALSSVGAETREWCGTGWTGQPVVWERPDGVTEVIFGAYDRAVHFLDAATGQRTRPDFLTGDLIKGSVTLDPDGFPLLYVGSRDNRLRVLALDRPEPTELWALDAARFRGIWNNDWDGNPSIVDDILFEGGENGLLFAVRLNRRHRPGGLVAVEPRVLATVRSWTDELIQAVGDRNASIESSVAILEGRLYLTNSAGRVMGIELSRIDAGEAPVVLDFWMGDDVDASPTVDADGMLYVAAELERFLPRAAEVGQLVKLDPSRPADPIVWSLPVPPAGPDEDGGLWATPALARGMLYATTNSGRLLAVDALTGAVTWSDQLGRHAWSSPLFVDGTLIAANCSGRLAAYDARDPRRPTPLWTARIPSGACIESTPALWKGRFYVGARDGFFYALGDG